MDPTQYLHIQKQLLTNEKDKRPIIRLGKWFKDTMQCHALYEWIQPIKKSRPQIFVLAVCGSCAWVSPYILMHVLSNNINMCLKRVVVTNYEALHQLGMKPQRKLFHLLQLLTCIFYYGRSIKRASLSRFKATLYL